MKEDHFKWALIGIAGLLVLKYVVIGTCQWNTTLLPGQAPDAGSKFLYPLLGLIQTGNCDQVSTTIDYSGGTA